MAQESIVIDVQINQSEAADKLAGVTKQVIALTEEQKRLRKEIKDGTGDTRANAVALATVTDSLKTAKAAQSALEGQVVASMKVGQSYGTSLKEQAQALSALKDQYRGLTAAERESAGGKEMLNHIKDLDKAVKDNEASIGNHQMNVGNYPKVFDLSGTSLGKLASLFEAFGGSATKVLSGVKTQVIALGKTFLTPPIIVITAVLGAILLVIKKVSEAFKKNDEASTRLSKAFAVFQPLITLVGKAFDSLALGISKAIEFLASGVAVVTKFMAAIGLLPEGMEEATKAAQDLVQAQDDLEQAERDYTVNSAKRNKDISKLRNESMDKEKYSAKEREAMLKKAIDLEKQNLEDEKKNAAESLRILEAKAKQEVDTSDETANAIAAARAKMYDSETAYYDGTKRLNSQLLSAQEEMRQEAAKAVEAAKERKDRSLKFIQELQDATLAAMKDGAEKQIAQLKLTNEREIAEIQNRLNTEKGLTQKDKDTLNALILAKNKALQTSIQQVTDEASKERFDKEVAAENERLNLLLQSAAKGSEQELELRKTVIERMRQQELENTELTEQEKTNINAKYDLQLEGAENESIKRRYDAQMLAAQNDFESRKLNVINNEQELISLELEQAQAEADSLKAMDEETKAALYESQAAYEADVIASEARLRAAKQATLDKQNESVQMQFQVASKYTEAFGNIMQAFSEDSEAAAIFQKGLAIFNSTLKLGEAIAAATATSAAEGIAGVFALAGKIAAITAAFAGVVSSIKGATTPTAPKFAQGGVVPGSSFSGDNVIARVNSGEMILNDRQQANLLNIANGNQTNSGIDYELLATMIGQSVSQLPPPIMNYEEFTSFQKSVLTYNERAKI
jgi:hypothetical protein